MGGGSGVGGDGGGLGVGGVNFLGWRYVGVAERRNEIVF